MTDLMDAVETATTDLPRAYRVNSVPPIGSDDYPYAVFSAMFGRGDTYTLDASHSLRWGQVVFQCFGRTADSAADLAERVVNDLLDTRLDVGGYLTTPCVLELNPALTRDPDDNGVVGVTTTFTFTAIKEQP